MPSPRSVEIADPSGEARRPSLSKARTPLKGDLAGLCCGEAWTVSARTAADMDTLVVRNTVKRFKRPRRHDTGTSRKGITERATEGSEAPLPHAGELADMTLRRPIRAQQHELEQEQPT